MVKRAVEYVCLCSRRDPGSKQRQLGDWPYFLTLDRVVRYLAFHDMTNEQRFALSQLEYPRKSA